MNATGSAVEPAGAATAGDDAGDLAKHVLASTAVLRARLGGEQPKVAVLLGSGWSAVADAVEAAIEVPYADLPAFPGTTVQGHRARVVAGRIGGRPVLLLCGRRHAYEGGQVDAMAGAIRTLAGLGCAVLVQTNAAGSLEPAMRPGELLLITDHLNVVQRSPLLAERDDRRFVDLRDAYDPALSACARQVAAAQGIGLHEGTYAWVLGPQFETAAEIRMLQRLGAQAVGMSTVPETILARHAGMRVLALSMLTNMACGLDDEPLGHEQTLAGAARGLGSALRLLTALLPVLDRAASASAGTPGSAAPLTAAADTPDRAADLTTSGGAAAITPSP